MSVPFEGNQEKLHYFFIVRLAFVAGIGEEVFMYVGTFLRFLRVCARRLMQDLLALVAAVCPVSLSESTLEGWPRSSCTALGLLLRRVCVQLSITPVQEPIHIPLSIIDYWTSRTPSFDDRRLPST